MGSDWSTIAKRKVRKGKGPCSLQKKDRWGHSGSVITQKSQRTETKTGIDAVDQIAQSKVGDGPRKFDRVVNEVQP